MEQQFESVTSSSENSSLEDIMPSLQETNVDLTTCLSYQHKSPQLNNTSRLAINEAKEIISLNDSLYDVNEFQNSTSTFDPNNLDRIFNTVLQFSNVGVVSKHKVILNGVSGYFQSGKLNAVLGPKGSGKTTLLNVLSGRDALTEYQKVHGSVTINNISIKHISRHMIAYIMHNCHFYPTLTLKETFKFYAQVLLPNSMSWKKKMRRMLEVLKSLELIDLLNVKITYHHQQMMYSKEERSKISIAVHILSNPEVLLMNDILEEVDLLRAAHLTKILKEICVQQHIIMVMSLCRPCSQVIHLCDTTLLLSKGQVLYFGLTADAGNFFEKIGKPCCKDWSIADHMNKMATSNERTINEVISSRKKLCSANLEEWKFLKQKSYQKKLKNYWRQNYKYKKSSFFTQVTSVFLRYFYSYFYNYFYVFRCIEAVIIGIVCGINYYMFWTNAGMYYTNIGSLNFISTKLFVSSFLYTVYQCNHTCTIEQRVIAHI